VTGFNIDRWYGDRILDKVQKASVEAIDEVLEDTAKDAASNHWWASRSGNLEGAIVAEAAERTPRGARGRFGSTQHEGFYGLFLERKTPFLRPAADRQFPKLAAAIKRRLD